jgi:sugar lactone lactonase YvrE
MRSVVLLTTILCGSAWGQAYTISTIAGGGLPVNIPGTAASLGSLVANVPQTIAADRAGNVFFAYQNTVLRLDATTGILTLFAGNGTAGYSGDNGPAASAQLNSPTGLAVDSAGNLYIADLGNNRIRKVANGVITTVAGNGTAGFSGDGGPATSAQLDGPGSVAVDAAGNLYIAESGGIRKVTNGVITSMTASDGVAASGPLRSGPIAVDLAGNLYINDGSSEILKVANGVITKVAGGGMGGLGDNGPATSAQLYYPEGIAVDSAGNLYIADTFSYRIRKVSNGVITTVAGGGTLALGDNGPAVGALLVYPQGVAVDSSGNLYIADTGNGRIRKVSGGVITTVVGNGTCCFGGDNGPATSAQLDYPLAVAVDSAGSLYIADTSNSRIRKVTSGVIATVAGNATPGFSGDNGPATSAQLNNPTGVAVDSASNLYIADSGNWRIRKVSGGLITTVVGSTTKGVSGDNVAAAGAQLWYPSALAVDSAGSLYINDGTARIRKVSGGVIITVAGNGTQGSSGDNGPATSAQLSSPAGIAVDSAGDLYIADYGGNRIRKVANGVITTVAGNGTLGFSGDGGPATSAQLVPSGVAVDSAGNLFIADYGNNRIRKVANGVITTVAGGDTAAQLYGPWGVAVDSAGTVYMVDSGNNRIRVLTPAASPCTYSVSPTTLQAPASGGTVAIGIQTAASCPWAISGLPGWITVSAASTGAASASLALAVFPNNSGTTLSATITIAGASVAVTQPAEATAALAPINLKTAVSRGRRRADRRVR